MDDNQTPIEAAIRTAGTQKVFADALKISSASVSEWKSRGRVPAERVLEIERLFGVSRHDLRPDVFGPAPKSGRKSAA